MKRDKKQIQPWKPGDVFAVVQRDGVCSVGQVLTEMMKNVVSCAFYDVRVPCENSKPPYDLRIGRLIAVLSLSRERLDFGQWKVLGHQDIALPRELWPNEEFRDDLWVGSKVHDASIAEELLDAFNGLVAWDDWHDPEYLDKLLAHPDQKPRHLIYKKK
jgi:hypothetical protein